VTEFPAGSFDVIRLNHVMEHMPDPVHSLKVLREWLSDHGVIYLEVPEIEREVAQKLRGRLFHFGHIFSFNPFTFRLAAGLAGLAEEPATQSRFENITAGFFRKITAPCRMDEGARDNALRRKAAMDAHNSSMAPRPKEGTAAGRFARTIAAKLGEIIASARFRDHRAIAENFGKRISAQPVQRP